MKNKNENTNKEPFEFLLTINNNIICQRYFDIKGFNKKALNSVEFFESVDHVVEMIEYHLKMNTVNYLNRFHNPLETQSEEDIPKEGIWDDGLDIFRFYVKMNGRTLMEKPFYGNYYPPRIKYQVNIKEMVPEIVDNIRNVLSSKKVTDLKEEFNG